MSEPTDGCFLDREEIGKVIKRLRRRYGEVMREKYPNGFTQQDLCDLLNNAFDAQINVKKLSRIEAGKQEPSLSLAVQIAVTLGLGYWRGALCEMAAQSLPDGSLISKVSKDSTDVILRHAEADELAYLSMYFDYEDQVTEAMRNIQSLVGYMGMLLAEPERNLSLMPHWDES